MCRFLRILLFFFFKQKTAYEMRISDWSSDVCSSDLDDAERGGGGAAGQSGDRYPRALSGADAGAQRINPCVIASGAKQSRAVYAGAGLPRPLRLLAMTGWGEANPLPNPPPVQDPPPASTAASRAARSAATRPCPAPGRGCSLRPRARPPRHTARRGPAPSLPG